MKTILTTVRVKANKHDHKHYNVVLNADGTAFCPCQHFCHNPIVEKRTCGHVTQALLILAQRCWMTDEMNTTPERTSMQSAALSLVLG